MTIATPWVPKGALPREALDWWLTPPAFTVTFTVTVTLAKEAPG